MMTRRSVAVGVELGSTQATVALIDQQGQVLQRCVAKTLRGRPPTATLEPYIRAIDHVRDQARSEGFDLCGIGISVPGAVDALSRRPQHIPSISALNNFPLCDYLEAYYQLPSSLHTDVDAAILAERRFGAGKEHSRLFYLTVNAVVGASFVVDGQLERPTKYVGHISHVPIASSGPRCSCGKYGCINTLISFDALLRMVQRALRRGIETTLTRRLQNKEVLSHQILAEEAARGDSLALQIYREFGRWLSAAIQQYMSLFEPNIFILGGGVLHAGDLVIPHIESAIEAKQKAQVCSMVKVVPAQLGRDAGLVGSVIPLF